MTICACCGQSLPADRGEAMPVDNDVLSALNRAAEAATAAALAEVSAAHLFLELLPAMNFRMVLHRAHFNTGEWRSAAEAWLRSAPRRHAGARITSAAALQRLTARAAAIAARSGRTLAGEADLAQAFLESLHELPFDPAHMADEAALHRSDQPEMRTPRWHAAVSVSDASTAQQRTFAGIALSAGERSPVAPRTPRETPSDAGLMALLLQRLDSLERELRTLRERHAAAPPPSASQPPGLPVLARSPAASPSAAATAARGAFRVSTAHVAADSDRRLGRDPADRSGSERTAREPRDRSISARTKDGSTSVRLRVLRRLKRRTWTSLRKSRTWGERPGVNDSDGGSRQRASGWAQTAPRAPADWTRSATPRMAMYSTPAQQERARRAALHGAELDRADAGEDDEAPGRGKRFYLAPDDAIVRAPSIGPKTAARLEAAGLYTVRDLLNADPVDTAQRTGARFVTPARVSEWQAQARLVCIVPWLRGTHAQLLVGAGYRTPQDIVEAETGPLCAAILRFASTRDGASILRAGPPPDLQRIAQWVQYAAQAEPARAA